MTNIDTIRAAFEEMLDRRAISKEMDTDAWGRPKYKHSHVDAMWDGWIAALDWSARKPEGGEPDGWVLVPANITFAMQQAYFDVIDKNLPRVSRDVTFGRYDSNQEAYRAMLSAAPKPPEREAL